MKDGKRDLTHAQLCSPRREYEQGGTIDTQRDLEWGGSRCEERLLMQDKKRNAHLNI